LSKEYDSYARQVAAELIFLLKKLNPPIAQTMMLKNGIISPLLSIAQKDKQAFKTVELPKIKEKAELVLETIKKIEAIE